MFELVQCTGSRKFRLEMLQPDILQPKDGGWFLVISSVLCVCDTSPEVFFLLRIFSLFGSEENFILLV